MKGWLGKEGLVQVRILAVLLAFIVATTPARADWHEASSDHFVIYADQSPETIMEFSDRLERYRAAMQFLLSGPTDKPSPSNRVTVYVVRNINEVQKLEGSGEKYVAGFYQARAGGSFAIIPRVKDSEAWELSGETILFHEYAHHFMYGSSSATYPRWLSEGFAEFYASAKFEKDGSVGLGLPANARWLELNYAKPVPIELLLDTKAYDARKNREPDEFYGRSWLLFHYLFFDKARKGQLEKYLGLLRQRTVEIEAAKAAFGDLDTLEKELDRYQKQKRMSYVLIKAAALSISKPVLRKLDEGEAAIMPVRISSKRGVTEEMAVKLLPEARKIAAKYPQNAAVLSALAEAEFDAGNDKEAIAAADATVTLDPNNINAYLQKSYAMARQADDITDEKEARKAWAAVRSQLLKANGIENNHPVPLTQYYLTYARSGATPTENAIRGLEWALQLAPYDEGLRLTVAQQDFIDERYDEAIATLRPIANSPHQSQITAFAQQMIDKAEAAKAGTEPEADAEFEAEATEETG